MEPPRDFEDAPQETWPRENDARDYLNQHRVLELFDNLTSQLIYHRPDNPKKFLAERVEELNKSKATHINYPCLFDDSNVLAVFGLLDPTNRGYVTVRQYEEALETLGVTEYDRHPPGADNDRITMDIFVREAKTGLVKASATF